MKIPIRSPEEILAYRSLAEMIGRKARDVWSVGPSDSVLKAAQVMADKDIGFVVVVDDGVLVGAVSERDCLRRVSLAGKALDVTPVSEIMAVDVVAVGFQHTFADCLRLMHLHRIRHLPVVRGDEVAAVISVRDLLSEAVEHHRRIVFGLEHERLQIFTSMA